MPERQNDPLNEPLRTLARAEIRAAFTSADPRIHANAIEAAQNTLGQESRDMIIAGLNDRDAIVRFAAAMAAGKLKISDLHPMLFARAQDPSVKVRIGVRYALHRLGDVRLSHELEETAADPNPRVREDTAFVLGLLGVRSALNVLNSMTADADSDVRLQVAEAMWRLGDESAKEVLLAGLITRDAVDYQMLCLMALVAPRDRRIEPYVYGKLTDPYPEVSLVAARGMGNLGSDAGYGVALEHIRSDSPMRRYLAALAFGAIGRSDAQNLLAPLLKDPEPRVRLAAATSLLQLREPAAISAEAAAMTPR